ncbi:MAPK-activated protein kinase Srk1 [Aspergillus fumigatus]
MRTNISTRLLALSIAGTSNLKTHSAIQSTLLPAKKANRRQLGNEDMVNEGEFIPGEGAGGIGVVRIADFGLSKVISDSQTVTPCGTVGYTAPETVKDERYSKSVDIWALGCVLYTLLCGFPPFYDEVFKY